MSTATMPLERAMAEFLRGFGFRDVATAPPLAGGMFSRPLPVRADGVRYVLRTHTFRGTEEAFRFQAEVVAWAAAQGVGCARVVATPGGAWCQPLPGGRGVLALHEFVDGVCDDWNRWHERKVSRPEFLRDLGGQVARLHDVLRHAPRRGDAALSAELPPIQFDQLAALERHWNGELDRLASACPASPATGQLSALRPRIAEFWRMLRAATEPRWRRLARQIVHGDVSPVNLVWRADGAWSLIDWDCTHVGSRLYDALGDVLNRPPVERADLNRFDADHVAIYLAGYDAALDEGLTEDERALIPAFCLARQLEDLRQRARALPTLAADRHGEFATLITRRVEMLDQMAAHRDLWW